MSTEYAPRGVPPADPQPAEGLTDAVREQAQSVGEPARARPREQVDRRSNELGTRATSVTDAQWVAGASDYLEGTDGNRLLRNLESRGSDTGR